MQFQQGQQGGELPIMEEFSKKHEIYISGE